MWLKLWLEYEAEQDAELQKAMTLRITDMCWLHLPRKGDSREGWSHTLAAYDALNGSHPNLYAPHTLTEVIGTAKKTYPATVAHCDRWIAHYENRIAYERTILDEQGGLKTEDLDIQPDGHVLVDDEWLVMIRINKRGGQINNMTTNAYYVRVHGIKGVKGYRAPTKEDAARIKKIAKLPPLVDFPGEGFIEMTTEKYKRKPTDYKGTRAAQAAAEHGAYRYRTTFLADSGYWIVQVYITDAKHVDKPAPETAESMKFEHEPVTPAPVMVEQAPASTESTDNRTAMAEDSQAMHDQLKAGVQVVSIPQLFPAPADLAARMVGLANIEPEMHVLEPGTDTGRILEQLPEGCEVVTMKINAALGDRLDMGHRVMVIDDFLQCAPEAPWGSFDRILMNPPFANADDVKRIRHALRLLKPDGELVAVCASDPRQNNQLRPLVEQHGGEWENLSPSAFAESGTAVNTALLILTT